MRSTFRAIFLIAAAQLLFTLACGVSASVGNAGNMKDDLQREYAEMELQLRRDGCLPLFRNPGGCGGGTLPAPESLNRAKRMVNGDGVEVGRWPWYVQVVLNCSPRYIVTTDQGVFEEFDGDGSKWIPCGRCGGSIVAKHWVLTAAHCTDSNVFCTDMCNTESSSYARRLEDKYKDHNIVSVEFAPEYLHLIIAGAIVDRLATLPEQGEQALVSKTWYTHPAYDVYEGLGRTRGDNDITLTYVPGDGFTFNERVSPVCVNAVPNPQCAPQDGQVCYMAGLSTGAELLEAKVEYYNLEDCNSDVGATCDQKYGSRSGRACAVLEDKLCSRDPAGEQGACDGDSGGPFVCPLGGGKAGRWWSVGVIQDVFDSLNPERHCDPKGINTHTNVSHFLPWIVQTVVSHEVPDPDDQSEWAQAKLHWDKASISPVFYAAYAKE